MIKIVPNVKELKTKEGFLKTSFVCFENLNCDKRVQAAINKLPLNKNGAKLDVVVGECGENYELFIEEDTITIKAGGPQGAFYAVQTLRQIFDQGKVPCLYIKDEPDFKYRGFYHDVTRGKIPTVSTIKSLIDNMAYYKLNSLQLYVEHVFEFEEYRDLRETHGYITKDEMREIGEYCKENFIDFVPSLSTFGHLYELLNQEKYKHLRVLKDYKNSNFWHSRMERYTIDPLHPESIGIIKSLIDQYEPNFESDYFNICCDETNDLAVYREEGIDVGKIYVDFVKQIIAHVKEKNKTVMMWADVLLKHPETINDLPQDTVFLNWEYEAAPNEEKIKKFASLNRKQVVCPGTTTWNRFCEDIDVAEKNISLMAEYGYKYGALGVLNTNWGDWGNICSIELAMYGLVLGAEKSWSVNTEINQEFYDKVNAIVYKNDNGLQYLKELNKLHSYIHWLTFCNNYFVYQIKGESTPYESEKLSEVQNLYKTFAKKISLEKWANDEYREEMLIAAKGICLVAELWAKISGTQAHRLIDTKEWLDEFSAMWLKKNKRTELDRLINMFTYLEEN